MNINCFCPACGMIVSQGKGVEHIRECHPEIAELIKREKEAILCPYPIKEDNGTIKDCIKKGHCACSEKD